MRAIFARIRRRKVTRTSTTFVSIVLLSAVFMSCTSTDKNTSPPIEPPSHFSKSGSGKLPQRWWKVFDNPELNAVIAKALQSNFSLKTAWSRLQEARSVVDRETAALFPDLEVFSNGEIRRSGGNETQELQLGVTSTYEVDLWGKIQSRVEAEQYRAEATRADYQTAKLSVSAEVVRTWFRLMSAQRRLDLLKQQIETNKDLLNLLETRFARGQIRRADVLRQKELLNATQQQKYSTESRIKTLQNQLSVLMGQPPQVKLDYPVQNLPDLPPLPDTGVPAELIQRRPDIQRAHRELKAADKQLAAAISDRYPRITLTASLSTAANEATHLFEQWARSFAGDITAPLLDAGERKAEVSRRKAQKEQRLYEYGQAILTALQEVENALTQEQKQQEQVHKIEKRLGIAKKTYNQLRSEYLHGVTDFLDVLNALTDKQELRRELISARLKLVAYRIALYRALAGGFERKNEAKASKN